MSDEFINKIVAFEKREWPKWFRPFSIVVFPILFILFILSPSFLLSESADVFFGLGGILIFPMNIYVGIPIFIIGGFIYAWTILLFADIGQGTQVPVVPTQKLVVKGPYQYSRNPMFLGVILFISGLGFILNSISFVVIGLVIPLSYLVFIKLAEEKELEARFGQEYTEYKSQTPFLFPALRKRKKRWPAQGRNL